MNNQIKDVFKILASALRPANYENTTIPKARTNGAKKSGKTRRGATHRVGMHKMSRALYSMSPAEYRRKHLGVVTIVPNYKKPHPAPRWRNQNGPNSN